MKAVLDRLGGQYAVVLLGKERYRITLPLACLPCNACENDVLELSIRVDPRETMKKHKRVIFLKDVKKARVINSL